MAAEPRAAWVSDFTRDPRAGGIEPSALLHGIFHTLITVTYKAATRACIGDPVPDRRYRLLTRHFTRTATLNGGLVATLHNEYVFHGVTGRSSHVHINYRSKLKRCKSGLCCSSLDSMLRPRFDTLQVPPRRLPVQGMGGRQGPQEFGVMGGGNERSGKVA